MDKYLGASNYPHNTILVVYIEGITDWVCGIGVGGGGMWGSDGPNMMTGDIFMGLEGTIRPVFLLRRRQTRLGAPCP